MKPLRQWIRIFGRRGKRCRFPRGVDLWRRFPRDEIGMRFGRWTVIGPAVTHAPTDKTRGIRWRCRCDCGYLADVVARSLRNGKSRSCGCLRAELTRKRWSDAGDLRTRYAMRTG